MIFNIDRRIYSDACITNTIYWLSNRYVCKRILNSDISESIEITPLIASNTTELEAAFWSSLNDYKLRDIIATETKDIRTIIYAKAFAESESITEAELNEI